MIAFLLHLFVQLIPHQTLQRYRVTPRHNQRAFRREVLARIIHTLRHDSAPPSHG
jgi:hypothetical protein